MHIWYLKLLYIVLLQVNGQTWTTTAPLPPDDACIPDRTTATPEAIILNQIYSEELAINGSEEVPIKCDRPLMVNGQFLGKAVKYKFLLHKS